MKNLTAAGGRQLPVVKRPPPDDFSTNVSRAATVSRRQAAAASLRAFYTPTHKRLTGRGERSVSDRSANMPHSISRATFAVFRWQEMYYICKLHTWYGSVLLHLLVFSRILRSLCLRLCQWCDRSCPTVPEQDRSQTKKKSALVSVLQVWCCVVKHDLVTLVVIMILKDTAIFQVLFIISLFCAWNITTVEINSVDHLLKS